MKRTYFYFYWNTWGLESGSVVYAYLTKLVVTLTLINKVQNKHVGFFEGS